MNKEPFSSSVWGRFSKEEEREEAINLDAPLAERQALLSMSSPVSPRRSMMSDLFESMMFSRTYETERRGKGRPSAQLLSSVAPCRRRSRKGEVPLLIRKIPPAPFLICRARCSRLVRRAEATSPAQENKERIRLNQLQATRNVGPQESLTNVML
jgi:hypothetical protein